MYCNIVHTIHTANDTHVCNSNRIKQNVTNRD